MSRYVDPRAPTGLTSVEIDTLKADPEIIHLRELRDRLSHEVREESGTIRKAEAEGTKLYQMYKKANNAFNCAKAKSLNAAKKSTRQQFFDTIDTIEINKQLEPSFLDLNEDDWQPEKVEHHLKERRLVAGLLCNSTFNLSDQAKLDHRIKTANAIIALCQRREAPRRQKRDRTWGIQQIQHVDEAPKPPPFQFPKKCEHTQCIFCFNNPKEPNDVRLRYYSTVYKARNHVELHLNVYKRDDPIPCPDPGCQETATILQGRMRFMNHAASKHDYDIFRKRGE